MNKSVKSKQATHKAPKTPKPDPSPKTHPKVAMVAIGASAGGLAPFERFFDSMSANSGIAFVVIQHLSPDFESMMDELLSRHSSMDIKRVVDDLPVKANTIYLNPPRSQMIVSEGRFKLMANPQSQKLNLPIDIFFESLAEEYGDQAVAIILSGTGSDGTRGAATVKKVGGTVIAQSPESAKFDGMPRSVIESGNFDAVAAPWDMPDLIKRVRAGKSINQDDNIDSSSDPAQHIFYRLRDKFGTDFGYYKDATIRRRLERRAQLSGVDLSRYAKRLETDDEELNALYGDLLIDVTSFFRDIEGYKSLTKLAVEPLGKLMTHDKQIRVWVAGCASGEEAYSIAIAFAEYARENNVPLNLKILATDVHQRSLGAAAEGIYPKSRLTGLSDEQIDRYFEKHVDYYQVNQQLRRLVVFSQHNLLRDPPFTRIDLLTCRNVMIYFQEQAQQKTLALFHFALKINGYLFLGPSESLGKLTDEFEMLDRRWKIYTKLRDVRLIEATSLLPRNSRTSAKKDFQAPFLTGRSGTLQRFQKAHGDALEMMLRQFAPPGFLLNNEGEIVHVFGSAGNYVKVEGGMFSNRIIDLIEPQLRLAVTAGLERLTTGEKPTFERRVLITNPGKNTSRSVIVSLKTLAEIGGPSQHFLLTLISAQSEVATTDVNAKFLDTSESTQILQRRIKDLERDLTSTEESLQAMVEELQTSNEELQATNEELMASNEELQSTNEELHSVNEELYTVSAEHQRKIDELTVLTDDMNLLLQATSIGIIFLDEKLNIRRFTESATVAFNLLSQDIGRPFQHVTYTFKGLKIKSIVKEVLKSKTPVEHEIQIGDRDYSLRVLPYITAVRHASGIVITLVDVTQIRRSDRERLAQKQIYETVLNDLTEAVMRVDLNNGVLVTCNDSFANQHGKFREDIIGKKLSEVIDPQLAETTFAEAREHTVGELFRSEIIINNIQGRQNIISRRVRIIGDEAGNPIALQATGSDMTAEFRYTQALEAIVNINENTEDCVHDILSRVLEIGVQYLNLSYGVIAEIREEDFIIVATNGIKSAHLKPGDVLPYNSLMSAQLPTGKDVIAIRDTSKSHYKAHESLKDNKVATYVGVRMAFGEQGSATMTLTSDKVRGEEFTDLEKTIVQLLSRVASFYLEQDLHMANLTKRQIELEKSNEGLNRFTYLASHDLQEPLRKIQQSGELLQLDYADKLDEDGVYFLKIMTESSGRMRALIDDLLLYSASANQDIITTPTHLNELVDTALSDLEQKIAKSNATINVDPLPVVSCDATVIILLITNIIGNSLKYRSVDIAPLIHIFAETKDNTHILHFTDNGIGIKADKKVNIFDPFIRLHSKKEYHGSGIGLALCKSICDRHGWDISYSSQIGKGTDMMVSIPITM